MEFFKVPWIFTIVIFVVSLMCDASIERKIRPPLVEEAGRRKIQRQTHCQFGNQTYELEERWRPDLGPPFGMLYCMRCECMPIQRKRKIMSKVRCKNIRNDCPKPTCDDPVLLPQRCCKTCLGEDYADLEEDIAAKKFESEDDDKVLKEFTVLLTGKFIVPPVSFAGAASGHLVYTKRDLHYTIHYQRIPRPLFVRFTSEEGNILEEHEIHPSPQHEQGSKVCGVWRKIPKVYRRFLQKDRLLFVLVTAEYPDGIVGGRIMKHNPINTEAYDSLLLPDRTSKEDESGTGGMATIFPVSDAIHVTLGFNGIFTARDSRNAEMIVSLMFNDQGRWSLLSETTESLAKAHPDFNAATVKLDLPSSLQERLSSGKFLISISSKDGLRKHSGLIIPKVTCNVFQAVMTPTEVLDSSKEPVTGFMILDIGLDGFINYKLHVSDPSIDSVTVQLETEVDMLSGTGMRVLQQVVQNLTDSWGNGSFSHRSGPEVEMMLSNDLAVTAYADVLTNHISTSTSLWSAEETSTGRSRRSEKIRLELRGAVKQTLYTDAFLSDLPILLSGGNSTASGVAWLSVDKDCVLHYQVYVSGLDSRERHLLELLQVRPGKYSNPLQRVLKKFEGEQIEDTEEDLDGRSMAFLHHGHTYLVITSRLNGKPKTVQLRAKINELYIPPKCLPRTDISTMQRTGHTYQDGYNDVYGGTDSVHKCMYEGNLYEDGEHWKAEHAECSMCSCRRGRVDCEAIVCPEPNCDSPINVAGECCPFCPGNTSDVGFHRSQRLCFFEAGDRKYHVAGSRWHPYVPPFGFSTCSLCTCDAKTLTVRCERVTCPPLYCSEREALREHPNACCKKCPNSIEMKSEVIIPPSGQLGDQSGERRTVKELLASGGCSYQGRIHPNGDEWHPTIEPYGVEKCVKCSCKDGKAKCRKKKCPKQICPVKVPAEDDCCETCVDTVLSDSSAKSSEANSKGRRKKKDRERRHKNRKDKQQ